LEDGKTAARRGRGALIAMKLPLPVASGPTVNHYLLWLPNYYAV